jgi:hypothetical protein
MTSARKGLVHLAAAAALAGAAAPALAQAGAVVEGVQMPAWIERRGETRALAPGEELRAGDRLRTGAGARVLVKLPEGSAVKLGERARFEIAEMPPERDGAFRALLRVVEGAFRFTTDALSKVRRREVSVSVGTVIAGVRGTDLWGKSMPDREIVCLIEGRIEVGAPGESPVVMDQPRQFYNRVGGRTQPLGFVEPDRLVQWSAETEIEAGRGAAVRGGKWKVALARHGTEGAARAMQKRLGDAGFAAEVGPVREGRYQRYEVRIEGLPSRAEAGALAARLRGQHGADEPMVSE